LRANPSDRIGGAYHRPSKPPKRKRRRTTARRLGRWLVIGVLLGLTISVLLVLPLRWINPPTTAFVLQDSAAQNVLFYDWAAWENIGTAGPLAVVAAEDQRFATHFGFDINSIRQSLEARADGATLRGASTITQQTAKNLYLWPGRNFLRKGIEAYFTVLIETALSKQRILEIYLNIIEFGPGIFGISAASNTYFGKSPDALTDTEAALLAAVLPNPKALHVNDPSDYVRDRQRWIDSQMQRLRREDWITLVQ
jgi:monofunctional biosynthetic peptidoglycan transglycosylase